VGGRVATYRLRFVVVVVVVVVAYVAAAAAAKQNSKANDAKKRYLQFNNDLYNAQCTKTHTHN